MNKLTQIFNISYISKLTEIKISVALKLFGQALFNIYEPIILYNIFNENIELILFYYFGINFLYSLSVYFGSKLVSKIGTKTSMIIGTFFLIIYSIFLIKVSNFAFGILTYQELLLIVALITFFICYQLFYWPAFHTYFSLNIKDNQLGENVSILYFISKITSIVGPILGGLILFYFNLKTLILLKIVFILVSIIPLTNMSNKKIQFNYKFISFIKEIFSFKKLSRNIPFFAEGAESYISSVIWGLFIYITLQSYISLGLIAAGVTLINGIIILFIGKTIDKDFKARSISLKGGTFISFLGWLIKGLPGGIYFYYLSDNIQKFGHSIAKIPFERKFYSLFGENKIFTFKLVLQREISLHLGAGLVLLVLGLISIKFEIFNIAFIIAAFSSILISFI